MKAGTISVAELHSGVANNLQRGISHEFVDQLLTGNLGPLLERVRCDDTLNLEIRNGYVDIYYRGGVLVRLRATAITGRFAVEVEDAYCNIRDEYCRLPDKLGRAITSPDHARRWVDALGARKQVMDIHFSQRPKIEREYEQAVVRDNNRHKTGERSDYLIVDVEYAQSKHAFPGSDYRFDMVGFRWPLARGSRIRGTVTPVIMEMKAGDGALTSNGNACGLLKHVADVEAFLKSNCGEEPSGPYQLLCEELVRVFDTKRRLGLPSIPQRMLSLEIMEVSVRPEMLFVIANHQPGSGVLDRELTTLEAGDRADYCVAQVKHTGYALFAKNMKPLDEFVAELREKERAEAERTAELASAL